MNKKTVVILGNGFDLDLHYVTSYKDFVESDYFAPMKGKEIPKDIIIFFQASDKNSMQIYPNGLAKYILDFKEYNNWVDLEICVRDYCKLHVNDIDFSIIKKEFFALRFFLYHFISHSYAARNETKRIGQTKTEVAYILMDMLAQSKADWNIWTFNYTYLCKDLLKDFKFDECEIESRIHYIHGSIYNGSTNIVLGTGNDSDVMKVCPDAIKSQWGNYTALKNLYDEQVNNAEHIIIMGHSVGETDSLYFCNLFDNSNVKSITIMTSNEQSLESIKKNLNKYTNSKMRNLIEKGNLELIPFVSMGFSLVNRYYIQGLCATEDSINKLRKILEKSL